MKMVSRKNRSKKYVTITLGIVNILLLARLATLFAPLSGAFTDVASRIAQTGRAALAITASAAPTASTAPIANVDQNALSDLSVPAAHADQAAQTVLSVPIEPNTPAIYTIQPAPFPGDTGFATQINIADIYDTRFLELVNHERPVNREADAAMIVPAWPGVAVSHTEISIHAQAREAVIELFAAARAGDRGAGDYYISSGYRDYEKQSQIYDEIDDKSYAQPPNHSEHQTGLAVDIMAAGVPQSDMAASQEGRWLAGNAWKYGLLLRYTDDKQGVTGIAGEPWHFRYIGQPHAWYCRQNDLCFEEYIYFLKESGGYAETLDGVEYLVLYQQPENSTLYVPENMEYTISGDNTGAYIITAWR
ncbi:MAG: M15 family metallopeptidase [Oscillospiraceae bacterium]|nr:M15 family metallopeptidase [Oscillospiraceae bacterium]